jgi:predicted glycoside hydrolase/deacetylase ChbG (UPF0249 family)
MSKMIEDMETSNRFSFCLCADDFALSPAVSRGILMALEAQRLTATSVMTTRPSWPEAARELLPFSDVADIGLHLNLTLGAPLSPMPRLAPAKLFPSIGTLIAASSRGRLPEAEIRTEIAAQIETFALHFGKMPDFVDGHQHVQVLTAIRPLLFDTLESFGLRGKIWLRDSSDRMPALLKRGGPIKKATAVAWLARGFAKAAAARGFATNLGFSGFSNFDPTTAYSTDFTRYLIAPGQRHLIMCHPGMIDDELKSLDPVTDSRPKELAFLLSPDFEACLERQHGRLGRLQPV